MGQRRHAVVETLCLGQPGGGHADGTRRVAKRHHPPPLSWTHRGLAALVAHCWEYLSTAALDLLLPACLDPVLEVRHGAVLGVSELLPALQRAGAVLTHERSAQVRTPPAAWPTPHPKARASLSRSPSLHATANACMQPE